MADPILPIKADFEYVKPRLEAQYNSVTQQKDFSSLPLENKELVIENFTNQLVADNPDYKTHLLSESAAKKHTLRMQNLYDTFVSEGGLLETPTASLPKAAYADQSPAQSVFDFNQTIKGFNQTLNNQLESHSIAPVGGFTSPNETFSRKLKEGFGNQKLDSMYRSIQEGATTDMANAHAEYQVLKYKDKFVYAKPYQTARSDKRNAIELEAAEGSVILPGSLDSLDSIAVPDTALLNTDQAFGKVIKQMDSSPTADALWTSGLIGELSPVQLKTAARFGLNKVNYGLFKDQKVKLHSPTLPGEVNNWDATAVKLAAQANIFKQILLTNETAELYKFGQGSVLKPSIIANKRFSPLGGPSAFHLFWGKDATGSPYAGTDMGLPDFGGNPDNTSDVFQKAVDRGTLTLRSTFSQIDARNNQNKLAELKSRYAEISQDILVGSPSDNQLKQEIKELENKVAYQQIEAYMLAQQSGMVGTSNALNNFTANFNKAEGLWAKQGVFWPNLPMMFLDAGVENFTSQFPLMVVAGGAMMMGNAPVAIAAVGISSFVGESTYGFPEALKNSAREFQYNPDDLNSMTKAAQDYRVIVRANEISNQRAAFIGSANAIAFGLMRPFMNVVDRTMVLSGMARNAATLTTGKALTGLSGVGFEMATEFGGEMGAQVFSGTPVDWGSGVLEGVIGGGLGFTELIDIAKGENNPHLLRAHELTKWNDFVPFEQEGPLTAEDAALDNAVNKAAKIVDSLKVAITPEGDLNTEAIVSAAREVTKVEATKKKPFEIQKIQTGKNLKGAPLYDSNYVHIVVNTPDGEERVKVANKAANVFLQAANRLAKYTNLANIQKDTADRIEFTKFGKQWVLDRAETPNEFDETATQLRTESKKINEDTGAKTWQEVDRYAELAGMLPEHGTKSTEYAELPKSKKKKVAVGRKTRFADDSVILGLESLFAQDKVVADTMTLRFGIPVLPEDVARTRILAGGTNVALNPGQASEGTYNARTNEFSFGTGADITTFLEEFDHQTLHVFGSMLLNPKQHAELVDILNAEAQKLKKAKGSDRITKLIFKNGSADVINQDGNFTELGQEVFANLMLDFRQQSTKNKKLPKAIQNILGHVAIFQSKVFGEMGKQVFTSATPEALDFFNNFYKVSPELLGRFFSPSQVNARVVAANEMPPDQVKQTISDMFEGKPIAVQDKVQRPLSNVVETPADVVGGVAVSGSMAAATVATPVQSRTGTMKLVKGSGVIRVPINHLIPKANSKVEAEPPKSVITRYKKSSIYLRGDDVLPDPYLTLLAYIGQGLSDDNVRAATMRFMAIRNEFRANKNLQTNIQEFNKAYYELIAAMKARLPKMEPGDIVSQEIKAEPVDLDNVDNTEGTSTSNDRGWVYFPHSGRFYQKVGDVFVSADSGDHFTASQVTDALQKGFAYYSKNPGIVKLKERLGEPVAAPVFNVKKAKQDSKREGAKQKFLQIVRMFLPTVLSPMDLVVRTDTGDIYQYDPINDSIKLYSGQKGKKFTFVKDGSDIYKTKDDLLFSIELGEAFAVDASRYDEAIKQLKIVSPTALTVPSIDHPLQQAEITNTLIDPNYGILNLYLNPKQLAEVDVLAKANKEPLPKQVEQGAEAIPATPSTAEPTAQDREIALKTWLIKHKVLRNPEALGVNVNNEFSRAVVPFTPVDDINELYEFHKAYTEETQPLFQDRRTLEEKAADEFTEGEKVQLKGSNIARIVTMLGDKLYSKDVGTTTGKELFQNAVDAIMRKWPNGGGKLAVYGSSGGSGREQQLSIIDNGTGMTPQVLLSKFLPAFVSGKEIGAGGGFGLAKLAFLGGSKLFELHTIAQLKDGSYVGTKLRGTGKGYLEFVEAEPEIVFEPDTVIELSSNLRMEYRYFEKPEGQIPYGYNEDFATGTRFSTEVKEATSGERFIERSAAFTPLIETLPGYLPRINDDSPASDAMFFSDSYVILEGFGNLAKTTVEFLTPAKVKDQTLIYSIDNAAATIDILADVGDKMKTARSFSIPVLNHGILQFSLDVWLQEEATMPENMAVNVNSKVKADDAEYPFTTSREALTDKVQKEIIAYIAEQGAIRRKEQLADFAKAKSNAPKFVAAPDLSLLDMSRKVPAEIIDRIANDPTMTWIAEKSAEMQNAVLKSLAKYTKNLNLDKSKLENHPTYGRAVFTGIMMNTNSYGVHFGKSIGESQIFHNPFLMLEKATNDANRINSPSIATSTEIYEQYILLLAGVSFHEALHQEINSEGESLARELTFMAGPMASTLAEYVGGEVTDEQAANIITTLKQYSDEIQAYEDQAAANNFINAQGGYKGYLRADETGEATSEATAGGSRRVRPGSSPEGSNAGGSSSDITYALYQNRGLPIEDAPDTSTATVSNLIKSWLAGSEQTSDVVRRGQRNIVKSLKDSKALTQKEADRIAAFVSRFAKKYFSGVGVSVKGQGELLGVYDFGDDLTHIFADTAREFGTTYKAHRVEAVAIHELWHSLSRFLPEKDIATIKNAYINDLEAYLKSNPWFYAFVGRHTMTPTEYRKFAKKYPKAAEEHIVESEDGSFYQLRFDGDNYRFFDLDEYIVERLTRDELAEFDKLEDMYHDVLKFIEDDASKEAITNFKDSLVKGTARLQRRAPLVESKAFWMVNEDVDLATLHELTFVSGTNDTLYQNRVPGRTQNLFEGASNTTKKLLEGNKYQQLSVGDVAKAVDARLVQFPNILDAVVDFSHLINLPTNERNQAFRLQEGGLSATFGYGLQISSNLESLLNHVDKGTGDLPPGWTSDAIGELNAGIIYQVERLQREGGRVGPVSKAFYQFQPTFVVQQLKMMLANSDGQFFELLTKVRRVAREWQVANPNDTLPIDTELNEIMADNGLAPEMKPFVMKYWQKQQIGRSFLQDAYNAFEAAGLTAKIKPENEENILKLAELMHSLPDGSAQREMIVNYLSIAVKREMGLPVLDFTIGQAINTMLTAKSVIFSNLEGGTSTSIINYILSSATMITQAKNKEEGMAALTNLLPAVMEGVKRSILNQDAYKFAFNETRYVMIGGKGHTSERLEKAVGFIPGLSAFLLPKVGQEDAPLDIAARTAMTLWADTGNRVASAPDAWIRCLSQEAFTARELYVKYATEYDMAKGTPDEIKQPKSEYIAQMTDRDLGIADYASIKQDMKQFILDNKQLFLDNSTALFREHSLDAVAEVLTYYKIMEERSNRIGDLIDRSSKFGYENAYAGELSSTTRLLESFINGVLNLGPNGKGLFEKLDKKTKPKEITILGEQYRFRLGSVSPLRLLQPFTSTTLRLASEAANWMILPAMARVALHYKDTPPERLIQTGIKAVLGTALMFYAYSKVGVTPDDEDEDFGFTGSQGITYKERSEAQGVVKPYHFWFRYKDNIISVNYKNMPQLMASIGVGSSVAETLQKSAQYDIARDKGDIAARSGLFSSMVMLHSFATLEESAPIDGIINMFDLVNFRDKGVSASEMHSIAITYMKNLFVPLNRLQKDAVEAARVIQGNPHIDKVNRYDMLAQMYVGTFMEPIANHMSKGELEKRVGVRMGLTGKPEDANLIPLYPTWRKAEATEAMSFLLQNNVRVNNMDAAKTYYSLVENSEHKKYLLANAENGKTGTFYLSHFDEVESIAAPLYNKYITDYAKDTKRHTYLDKYAKSPDNQLAINQGHPGRSYQDLLQSDVNKLVTQARNIAYLKVLSEYYVKDEKGKKMLDSYATKLERKKPTYANYQEIAGEKQVQ